MQYVCRAHTLDALKIEKTKIASSKFEIPKDYKKQGLFKRYRGENLRTNIIREQLSTENHHGPRFQKELLSLAKRVIKEF